MGGGAVFPLFLRVLESSVLSGGAGQSYLASRPGSKRSWETAPGSALPLCAWTEREEVGGGTQGEALVPGVRLKSDDNTMRLWDS